MRGVSFLVLVAQLVQAAPPMVGSPLEPDSLSKGMEFYDAVIHGDHKYDTVAQLLEEQPVAQLLSWSATIAFPVYTILDTLAKSPDAGKTLKTVAATHAVGHMFQHMVGTSLYANQSHSPRYFRLLKQSSHQRSLSMIAHERFAEEQRKPGNRGKMSLHLGRIWYWVTWGSMGASFLLIVLAVDKTAMSWGLSTFALFSKPLYHGLMYIEVDEQHAERMMMNAFIAAYIGAILAPNLKPEWLWGFDISGFLENILRSIAGTRSSYHSEYTYRHR